MAEEYAIGEHLISVNVVRKGPGDKKISQWAVQRWFETEAEAADALRYITSDLVVGGTNGHFLVREEAIEHGHSRD